MLMPFWISAMVVSGPTAGRSCSAILGVDGMAFAVITM